MTSRVLINEQNRTYGSYVEICDDGTVKAGEYPMTARKFGSAEAAYAHHRPLATGSGGTWAWKVCQTLEDYMDQRDDGR